MTKEGSTRLQERIRFKERIRKIKNPEKRGRMDTNQKAYMMSEKSLHHFPLSEEGGK
jgi:hypothetical protein